MSSIIWITKHLNLTILFSYVAHDISSYRLLHILLEVNITVKKSFFKYMFCVLPFGQKVAVDTASICVTIQVACLLFHLLLGTSISVARRKHDGTCEVLAWSAVCQACQIRRLCGMVGTVVCFGFLHYLLACSFIADASCMLLYAISAYSFCFFLCLGKCWVLYNETSALSWTSFVIKSGRQPCYVNCYAAVSVTRKYAAFGLYPFVLVRITWNSPV